MNECHFLSHLEFRTGHNPFMDPNIRYVLLFCLLCHWTNLLQSHSSIKKRQHTCCTSAVQCELKTCKLCGH